MTQDPAATGTDPQDPHDARATDEAPEPAPADQAPADQAPDEDEAEVRANRPTGADDVGA